MGSSRNRVNYLSTHHGDEIVQCDEVHHGVDLVYCDRDVFSVDPHESIEVFVICSCCVIEYDDTVPVPVPVVHVIV